MGEPNHELSPDDAALIAGETAKKIGREAAHDGIEFATVVGTSHDAGLNTYVEVVMATAPTGETIRIPSMFGRSFPKGQRVAIKWDPPAGCDVWGTPDMLVLPFARMSLACTGGKPGGGG